MLVSLCAVCVSSASVSAGGNVGGASGQKAAGVAVSQTLGGTVGLVPALSWTQGQSFPVVSGRTIYPTLAPPVSASASVSPPEYSTHWYAGSDYQGSSETAQTINVTIRVPYSAPLSDEFYYVILSAWDSNGSYDQLGFSNTYGTWGLSYSWTSGPASNPTYHYSSNAMALSVGATYTFSITTEGGVTQFIAYQNSTQVWSLDAPTGGNYLVVSSLYSGYYNYTDYEEIWQTDTSGGSPAFDFYFYDNYWVPTGGGENAATWTSWSSGAPSNVAVIISGNSVLVHNPLATVVFETDPTSFAASPGTITFSGQTYSNGQTAEYADNNYQATANAPTGYQFDHWEYSGHSGSSGSGVYVANINADPTTVQVNSDGWLEAVFMAVKMPTTVTLTASNTTPAVSQPVTFNATLSNGTSPLSGENVTIYHYLNNVRYNDTTNATNATGQITVTTSFGSPGQRTYYATFAGDSSYQNSTSGVVTINVTTVTKMPTTLTLTESNSTPAVNQSVAFNATLSSNGTALPSESVTIYHYLNNVRYNDTTNATNQSGQITVATSFGSPGQRTYYATFAGDSSYQASTSSVVTVNVTSVTKAATALTIAAPGSALTKQNFFVNGTLSASAVGIGNATITLQRSTNNATWSNVTTNVTNAMGGYQFSNNESAANTYYYRTAYDGNATYGNVTSSVVTVNVTKAANALTLTGSTTTPVVNQSVTFNATLTSSGTPLPSENVTIYHYLNNVRYNDTTNTTNATGQITVTTSFGSPGTRTYYATFAGDSSYQNSTSSVVTVNVTAKPQTSVTLTASTTTPTVNQSVTFNAALTSSGTPLPSENVTIYHYLNNVRYNDTTNATNATGQITVTTSFGSPGTRTYYATFAGDSSYQATTSTVVTIIVH